MAVSRAETSGKKNCFLFLNLESSPSTFARRTTPSICFPLISICKEIERFYWVLLGFYLVLFGFTWFMMVLLGFTGFYRFLIVLFLGFIEFYWVLLFFLVSLNFTGFYWDLLGFYLVLSGLTW